MSINYEEYATFMLPDYPTKELLKYMRLESLLEEHKPDSLLLAMIEIMLGQGALLSQVSPDSGHDVIWGHRNLV